MKISINGAPDDRFDDVNAEYTVTKKPGNNYRTDSFLSKSSLSRLSMNSGMRMSVPSLMMDPYDSHDVITPNAQNEDIGAYIPNTSCLQMEQEEKRETYADIISDDFSPKAATFSPTRSTQKSFRFDSETHSSTRISRLAALFTPTPRKTLNQYFENESVQKEFEIESGEMREMRECTKIGLEHFVNISCLAIHEILQLNYQSVGRFKKTKLFAAFIDCVHLGQLLEEKK